MDYAMDDSMGYAMGTTFLIIYMVVLLAISVLCIIGMWKMFQKAGVPGWASLVPFYNTYCMFKISMGNGWLFLLTVIPCVNFVVLIMMYLKLAKAFGRGVGFAIGLIFLNPIFTLMLGFGSSKYIGVQ